MARVCSVFWNTLCNIEIIELLKILISNHSI